MDQLPANLDPQCFSMIRVNIFEFRFLSKKEILMFEMN